jgi:hypothetical protein
MVALVLLWFGSASAQFGLGGALLAKEYLLGETPSPEEIRHVLRDPACQKELAEWKQTQADRRKRWSWYDDPLYAHPDGKAETAVEKFRRVVRAKSLCWRYNAWAETMRDISVVMPKWEGLKVEGNIITPPQFLTPDEYRRRVQEAQKCGLDRVALWVFDLKGVLTVKRGQKRILTARPGEMWHGVEITTALEPRRNDLTFTLAKGSSEGTAVRIELYKNGTLIFQEAFASEHSGVSWAKQTSFYLSLVCPDTPATTTTVNPDPLAQGQLKLPAFVPKQRQGQR